MPVVSVTEVAGGLQVFGDQRGMFVDKRSDARLDCGRQTQVQLGPVGFELRFVGHCAN